MVIFRMETKESIVKSRSHCPNCGHVLEWYELIPVVSFLIQGGECRSCKKRISFQYPLVEILTGIIFWTVSMHVLPLGYGEEIPSLSSMAKLAYLLAISSCLIVIFVYDLRHYIIPDKVLLPSAALVAAYTIFVFAGGDISDFSNFKNMIAFPLVSAIGAFSFFAVIFFMSGGKWIGFGDVKFAFFMGLFLGWPGIIVGLFLAWIMGGIIAVGLLVMGKAKMKSAIPFGPFLVAGTFFSLLWGRELMSWYLDMLTL